MVYHVAAFVMLSVLFAGCSQDRTVKIVSYNVGTFTKFEENSMSMIAEPDLPNTSEKTSSSLMLETVRQFCARFFSPTEMFVSL